MSLTKNFFKQLDEIENKILDGQSFEDAMKENNFKTIQLLKNLKMKKIKKNNL